MSPLDAIPNLRGLDGEGSVQVHQDADARIERDGDHAPASRPADLSPVLRSLS
mgnify:CR=1 FL=1